MPRSQLVNSVVTRLVASLVLCGVVVALGLGIIDLRYHEYELGKQLTEQARLQARTVHMLLTDRVDDQSPDEMADLLQMLIRPTDVTAARVMQNEKVLAVTDHWPAVQEENFNWLSWSSTLEESELLIGFDKLTLLRVPVVGHGRTMHIDLVVDGPAAQNREQAAMLGRLARQGLIIAVMVLIGLVLIRKWVTGPLSEIVQLVARETQSKAYSELSETMPGEFSHLAGAIARMLEHLSTATRQLRSREAEFEHLYQFAPAAMISLDRSGNIISANRRAADMLGEKNERDLIARGILECIASEDRGRLRQVIDRLRINDIARCELRIISNEKQRDVMVECAGVYDDDQKLVRVRLSLLDISESKLLQKQVADQSRLLNLVIDHMSDAILVVDSNKRVVAHNQRLASLLRQRPEAIQGQAYDPRYFWDDLGVIEQEQFVHHLMQVEADPHRSAQERFETQVGTFLFQGIAVHDAATGSDSRLWVVQEITPLEENQRLVDAQNQQLQALKRLGGKLRDLVNVDQMLEVSARQLFEIMDVEAVGIALRRDQMGRKGKQILHRGTGEYLLETNSALVEAVERELMPLILANRNATFWPDLPAREKWAKSVSHAGVTCLAGVPLVADADSQGILWVGRRGGERLDNRHIYLLEALAPIVAARLEIAEMQERMKTLDLKDAVTGLPNRAQFDQIVTRTANRPGQEWSIVVINLDRFREINERLSHELADELLKRIAGIFLRHSRKATFLARLEGPTFALLCPNTDLQQAAKIAERYRLLASEQRVALPDDNEVMLSASIGVGSSPDDGVTAQAVMMVAMARMELARRTGKNRVISDDKDGVRQAG